MRDVAKDLNKSKLKQQLLFVLLMTSKNTSVFYMHYIQVFIYTTIIENYRKNSDLHKKASQRITRREALIS